MDEKIIDKLKKHYSGGGVLLNDTDNDTWSHAIPKENKLCFYNGNELVGAEFYKNIERSRMLRKNQVQFFMGKMKVIIGLA